VAVSFINLKLGNVAFVLKKKEMVTWLAWTCSIKEESPLGRYMITKDSSCVRKGLIGLIVLGKVKV
jgi:hypothetical protein